MQIIQVIPCLGIDVSLAAIVGSDFNIITAVFNTTVFESRIVTGIDQRAGQILDVAIDCQTHRLVGIIANFIIGLSIYPGLAFVASRIHPNLIGCGYIDFSGILK